MSIPDSIPLAGYRLEKVYALELVYQMADPSEPDPDTDRRETTLFWDWRLTSERSVEVYMRAHVARNRDVLEDVTVGLLGEFTFVEVPTVKLDQFISVNAPAMLLPYVREHISSLTGRGPYAPFFLPSVNVVELGESYEFNQTSGAAQIREDPALAERLGLTQLGLELPQAEV